MFEQLRQRLQRQLWTRASDPRQRRKSPANVPAWSESLEDRTLLSAIMVTTADDVVADDGLVSLREAIEAANTDTSVDGSAAGNGADTIYFSGNPTGSTITLNGEQLVLTDDVTIVGLGQDSLTLDGDHESRIFRVQEGVTATIASMTLTGGEGVEVLPTGHGILSGGAIYNEGDLTLYQTTLVHNDTIEYGGAIENSTTGNLTIRESTIDDNRAGLPWWRNQQPGLTHRPSLRDCR